MDALVDTKTMTHDVVGWLYMQPVSFLWALILRGSWEDFVVGLRRVAGYQLSMWAMIEKLRMFFIEINYYALRLVDQTLEVAVLSLTSVLTETPHSTLQR